MIITPEELVEARTRLLDAAVSFFSSDPGVDGIYLAGSLADDTADAYSDIDLRVVAGSLEQKRLAAARLTAPAAWGDWLFNEWIEEAQHCVSHFRPFLKIDVFYIDAATFSPSPWLRFPTRVFLDRSGQVHEVIARSQQLEFPRPTSREVSRILSKALAGAHEVVRRIRRGESLFAQALLSEMRDHMSQLDEWLHRTVPAGPADLKTNRRMSASFRQALEDSCVITDAAAMEGALVRLAAVLREQVVAAHDQFVLDDRRLENDLYSVEVVARRQVA
jgi:predicted nucleotidyltransferase